MSHLYEPLTLDLDYCRQRQQRLLAVMERLDIERAVLFQPEHVQYFTGFRPGGLLSAAVSLDADGHCLLVAPNSAPEHAAADEVLTFEAQWHCTLRQDQREAIVAILRTAWSGRSVANRVGVEFSNAGRHLDPLFADIAIIDLEPELWGLRRAKDPDELAMIRRAVACTEAMYARAREVIEPGVTEIEVYNQLHAAAVEVAGEPLTGFGNDFQCNSPGGPPVTARLKQGSYSCSTWDRGTGGTMPIIAVRCASAQRLTTNSNKPGKPLPMCCKWSRKRSVPV